MNIIATFDGEYAFLSNFYYSPITIAGINFPTVEHAFQAMKTIDVAERQLIAAAPTPGKAKRLGRTVHLREDWEEAKESVMYLCLKAKFSIPELREKLLATDEACLIEGTLWHDNEWGSCSCEKCKDIVGKNKLGKLLMKVREELKNE